MWVGHIFTLCYQWYYSLVNNMCNKRVIWKPFNLFLKEHVEPESIMIFKNKINFSHLHVKMSYYNKHYNLASVLFGVYRIFRVNWRKSLIFSCCDYFFSWYINTFILKVLVFPFFFRLPILLLDNTCVKMWA